MVTTLPRGGECLVIPRPTSSTTSCTFFASLMNFYVLMMVIRSNTVLFAKDLISNIIIFNDTLTLFMVEIIGFAHPFRPTGTFASA